MVSILIWQKKKIILLCVWERPIIHCEGTEGWLISQYNDVRCPLKRSRSNNMIQSLEFIFNLHPFSQHKCDAVTQTAHLTYYSENWFGWKWYDWTSDHLDWVKGFTWWQPSCRKVEFLHLHCYFISIRDLKKAEFWNYLYNKSPSSIKTDFVKYYCNQ